MLNLSVYIEATSSRAPSYPLKWSVEWSWGTQVAKVGIKHTTRVPICL